MCEETEPQPKGADPGSEPEPEPILWAVENGITFGMTPTEFGTDGTCTRGQVVTFLYRVYN